MITEAERAAMRETAEDALPQIAAIERNTPASDGGGGQTDNWQTLDSSVPCRIAPVGGGETGTTGARVAQETTHIATLPAETPVAEADRLTIGDATYDVTLVRERGEWEITRRVECKEAG